MTEFIVQLEAGDDLGKDSKDGSFILKYRLHFAKLSHVSQNLRDIF